MAFKDLKKGDKLKCIKTLTFMGNGIYEENIYEVSHVDTKGYHIVYIWCDGEIGNSKGSWDIWEDDFKEYWEEIKN